MTEPTRLKTLNDRKASADARYVVYWMQQSQRADFNHALEYAIERANKLDQSVIVGFGLNDDYPDANERHYAFMLEGLAETARSLADRGIKLVMNRGSPDDVAIGLAEQASLLVCDRGYLRHQIDWRENVAKEVSCEVVQVESDVVVPVETVSDKAEYAARTIRKKINSRRHEYLKDVRGSKLNKSSLPLHVTGDLDLRDWQSIFADLDIDRSIPAISRFMPEAKQTAAATRVTCVWSDLLAHRSLDHRAQGAHC
ncbi:MAG: hypothetical protein HKN11_16375 [Rhizobiales bacterium]|nr:hypothetical protein [Hyphomicrobiales bacterium]